MSSTREGNDRSAETGQTGKKTTTRTSDSRRFAADSLQAGLLACRALRLPVRHLAFPFQEQWRGASWPVYLRSLQLRVQLRSSACGAHRIPCYPILTRRIGGMEPDKRIPKNVHSIARRRIPSQTKNPRRSNERNQTSP